MEATFGLNREQNNELFFNSYINVSGKFHFHSHLEIFFVDEGEVDVFINNKSRRLKKGEMSITLSYDAHAYHSAGESVSSLLIIPLRLCDELVSRIKNKRISDPFLCDGETVKELRKYYEMIKCSHQNELMLRGLIYVMYGIILERMEFTTVPTEMDADLSARLLMYINENFKNDIGLSDTSAHLGYNPSYISRYFKNCFNISFNHYIKIIRLKNAVMLMKEKKHSVTYCAMESGFNSMCTFYRAFYEEFGCTPKEYLSL